MNVHACHCCRGRTQRLRERLASNLVRRLIAKWMHACPWNVPWSTNQQPCGAEEAVGTVQNVARAA